MSLLKLLVDLMISFFKNKNKKNKILLTPNFWIIVICVHGQLFFFNLNCVALTGDISLLFLCSMNGALAFVDTSDCTIMYIAEHYMASDVEWDPTGRFVVTSVSWWSHKVKFDMFTSLICLSSLGFFSLFTPHTFYLLCLQVDNAYWLWTFQGRLLQKNNKDRFCQLLWRPRPPTLLSQDQIKVTGFSGVYICNLFS